MTKKELRKVSLKFRTLSSQMLKIDSQEEIGYMQAFFDFITETDVLCDYITSCHSKDYNFDEIIKSMSYHDRFILPSDSEELIDFEYQLIKYILSNKRELFWYGQGYTSSNKFVDIISAFMRKVIEPFVVALRSYLEICLIDANDYDDVEEPEGKKVFLSYCQKDSEIADLIDNRLSEKLENKAKITRDVRDVAYHESFGKFMRTIQDHDFVILVISDNYLKSRNCMYEVTEAIKDTRYDKRIIFIILKDEDKELLENSIEEALEANVYSADGQSQYTIFWKEAEEDLQARINEIGDPTYAIHLIKEKSIIQKILLDLPEFFEFIKDNNGYPLKKHISEDFESMLSFMGLND